jgi:hypothetical protein
MRDPPGDLPIFKCRLQRFDENIKPTPFSCVNRELLYRCSGEESVMYFIWRQFKTHHVDNLGWKEIAKTPFDFDADFLPQRFTRIMLLHFKKHPLTKKVVVICPIIIETIKLHTHPIKDKSRVLCEVFLQLRYY